MFERATSGLLKNSMLLHFAYADFEEVFELSDIHNTTVVMPGGWVVGWLGGWVACEIYQLILSQVASLSL